MLNSQMCNETSNGNNALRKILLASIEMWILVPTNGYDVECADNHPIVSFNCSLLLSA